MQLTCRTCNLNIFAGLRVCMAFKVFTDTVTWTSLSAVRKAIKLNHSLTYQHWITVTITGAHVVYTWWFVFFRFAVLSLATRCSLLSNPWSRMSLVRSTRSWRRNRSLSQSWTSTRNTLCRATKNIASRCGMDVQEKPSKGTVTPNARIRAPFLSLSLSKLRLCSANHRAGYFSNLTCDWLSIVWAYSEQATENRPWLDLTHWDLRNVLVILKV